MAALGASYRLRQEGAAHVLFDKNDHVGGHTASHDDGCAADPGAFADADEGPLAFLLANRRRRLGSAVGVAATRYMHCGPDQYVALDVHEAQKTMRAHIDMRVDAGTGLRKDGAE